MSDEICAAVADEANKPTDAETSDAPSATESSTEPEETDDAEETDGEEKPSETGDEASETGDEAPTESGAGDETEGGETEGGEEETGAGVKLGAYGWAGAAVAAVALVF